MRVGGSKTVRDSVAAPKERVVLGNVTASNNIAPKSGKHGTVKAKVNINKRRNRILVVPFII